MAAIGFQQHVLHREGRGPEGDDREEPAGLAALGKVGPGVAEARARLGALGGGHRAQMLLLPERNEVQEERHDRRALHDLDEAEVGEVGEERAEDEDEEEKRDIDITVIDVDEETEVGDEVL